MSDTVNRFIENTVNAFVPRKEYSPEQVVENLKRDIQRLKDYLMNNPADTKTWKEKAHLLRDKKEELEQIKKENQLT